MEKYPIATSGHLCNGSFISIGWPEPHEFDQITHLRNERFTRKWFLNSQTIKLEENRLWINSGMQRPKDALLCIRLKKDNSFLGTIGWTNWDLKTRTACFGRLAVDRNILKNYINCFPSGYGGIALDAAIALRDFAMVKMQINQIETFILSNNNQAKLVNMAAGLRETARSFRKKDGNLVEVIEMSLSKLDWLNLNKTVD